MSTAAVAVEGSLRQAVCRRVLSAGDDPALDKAVAEMQAASGGSVEAVVFFGSRRTGAARANAWSAHDLFAVVNDYRRFYAAMHRAGRTGKRPRFMAALSRPLAPTQISLRFGEPVVHLKVSVILLPTLRRETSSRRADHFTIGRLFQPSRILYAASEAARTQVADALVSAHAETWHWVRPWLPERFDADGYGRTALRVSMSWEVRPEPAGRAEALWEAQRQEQTPVFEALLAELAGRGELVPGAEGTFTLARRVGWLERRRWELYFGRSMARATLRWLKHVLSFEGWLDYIVRKASRHAGERIELTERERRWPWIFLWGRFIRYLRNKDRRRGSG